MTVSVETNCQGKPAKWRWTIKAKRERCISHPSFQQECNTCLWLRMLKFITEEKVLRSSWNPIPARWRKNATAQPRRARRVPNRPEGRPRQGHRPL